MGATSPTEPEAATGIILAGGRSRRLGRDKASEVLLGRSLLQRVVDRLAPAVADLLVITAPGQRLPALEAALPWLRLDDAYPGLGPLAGIYAGLLAARHTYALVVGCDMPLLSTALLRHLLSLRHGFDAVLPVLGGREEPLHAVYSRRCLAPMRAAMAAGAWRATAFLRAVRVRYVHEEELERFDPRGLSFFNINTEEDLERAQLELERASPP